MACRPKCPRGERCVENVCTALAETDSHIGQPNPTSEEELDNRKVADATIREKRFHKTRSK